MQTEVKDENGVVRMRVGSLGKFDVTYQVTHKELEKALQKWQDEYEANPEGFKIAQELGEPYGVSAARALMGYVHQVSNTTIII